MNVLGWHTYITIQVQVHNSTEHHPHAASCTYGPKQSLFPSHFPTFDHLHLSPSPPFPLTNTTLLSVAMCYTCFFFLNPFTFLVQSPQHPPLWHAMWRRICSSLKCLSEILLTSLATSVTFVHSSVQELRWDIFLHTLEP